MISILQNYPLAELTTFKIGGPAKFFAEVHDTTELGEALDFANKNDLAIFILGGGSNVLISDRGFDGLVILNKIEGQEFLEDGKVETMSGEVWDDVVSESVERNFAGIECLSGIPGTSGGALVQNIGAYGQTICDALESVSIVNLGTKQQETWSRDEAGFTYRNSYFKQNPDKYFILSFILRLEPDGKPLTSHPDVSRFLEDSQEATLRQVRNAIIEIRAKKGSVVIPGYESYNSAGSFFKNPIVEPHVFESAKTKLIDCRDPWHWHEKGGKVKIAAACLLSNTKYNKGYAEREVGISPKHSLALINLGQATAKDILGLAKDIKTEVKSKFGVDLENEVQIVGQID